MGGKVYDSGGGALWRGWFGVHEVVFAVSAVGVEAPIVAEYAASKGYRFLY
jgi:hypothetical protein